MAPGKCRQRPKRASGVVDTWLRPLRALPAGLLRGAGRREGRAAAALTGRAGTPPASDAAAPAVGLRGARWGAASRQRLAPAPPPKGSRLCFLCPDRLGLEIAGSPTAGINTSLQRFRGIWTTVSPRIGLLESTEWALTSWGSKDVNFWYTQGRTRKVRGRTGSHCGRRAESTLGRRTAQKGWNSPCPAAEPGMAAQGVLK